MLFGLAHSCGAATNIENHRFPSPDGKVAVIERTESGGGAAGWTVSELLLEGADRKRMGFGKTSSAARDAVVTWTSNSAASVCSRNFRGSEIEVIAVSQGDDMRRVTLTAVC